MKILIATDVFPPKSGGSGWSTFHLARALIERGHVVEVALPKLGARGVSTRVYEGVNVVEVGYTAGNVPGVRAWQRTRALEETFGGYLAMRGGEFDVVHAQHVLSIGAAAEAKKIAAAKKRTGIRFVSTVRDYWAVCLYGTLWRDGAVCPICRGGELTRCLGQRYGGAAKFMLPLVPLVEGELERRQRALQASDVVIAVSGFVKESLRGVVDEGMVRVVPNLIDVDETRQVAGLGGGGEKGRYLIFIGKLNALKGADLLPEIMAKSGVGLTLVLAGEGELGAELAGKKGFDARGWLSNVETLKLLGGAVALLSPSRWAEPLTRTMLEAQALGVPVVAFNLGGNGDIIEDSFNGFLAADVEAFADAVRRLVQDDALRARLGANAEHVAREKFSAGVVTQHLEQIYASLMRR